MLHLPVSLWGFRAWGIEKTLGFSSCNADDKQWPPLSGAWWFLAVEPPHPYPLSGFGDREDATLWLMTRREMCRTREPAVLIFLHWWTCSRAASVSTAAVGGGACIDSAANSPTAIHHLHVTRAQVRTPPHWQSFSLDSLRDLYTHLPIYTHTHTKIHTLSHTHTHKYWLSQADTHTHSQKSSQTHREDLKRRL